MSSESDDGTTFMMLEKRLGLCEACSTNHAKYSCPRCEVKTCSLRCLNLHKRELKCNGVRDKTKYVPLAKMTRIELLNDYYFLEECTKFTEDRKRDRNKGLTRYNKKLPTHLFRLQQAATKRKTTLKFLIQNFTERLKNTTELDFKSGTIFWRIEWRFSTGNESLLFVDNRLCENVKLYEAINKYLQPCDNLSVPGTSKLTMFQACGISGVELLLKAEGTKRSRNGCFLLDKNNTIRECLAGKYVVEFPTIFVVFKDQVQEYTVFESDDDLDSGAQQHMHVDKVCPKDSVAYDKTPKTLAADVIVSQFDEMNIDRIKNQLQNSKKTFCQKPLEMNYLFSEENGFSELSTDTDQGNSSAEENSVPPKKRPRSSVA